MTLEQTQRRRKAVATIHDIVGAMRAIAAGRIQGAQRALASSHHYEDIVIRSLRAVLADDTPVALPAAQNGTTLVLVMTSEQPLCGGFNQDVLSLAERRLRQLRADGELHVVGIGHRGSRQLAARGIAVDAVEPAATSIRGLRDVVKRLATEMDRRIAAGQLGTLRAIYNRYESISEQVPTDEQILPIDFSKVQASAPPIANRYDRQLGDADLLAGLISQYAFIRLYRIAADSFASEQASRLTAMDGATRNSEKMLQSLTDLERRERQGEITRQVLELVASRFADA